MKNSIKSLICALALSTALSFNASADDKEAKKVTGFGSGVYKTNEGKINISIDKFNKKPTTILLLDEKGNVIYEEITGKNLTKLRRLLDMNQLPSGQYTLQIVSDGEVQTKKIELSVKQPERLISMN